jgi:hypothetical protein
MKSKDDIKQENLTYALDLTLRINKVDCAISEGETLLYELRCSLKEHRKEHTLLLKEREGYLLKLTKK